MNGPKLWYMALVCSGLATFVLTPRAYGAQWQVVWSLPYGELPTGLPGSGVVSDDEPEPAKVRGIDEAGNAALWQGSDLGVVVSPTGNIRFVVRSEAVGSQYWNVGGPFIAVGHGLFAVGFRVGGTTYFRVYRESGDILAERDVGPIVLITRLPNGNILAGRRGEPRAGRASPYDEFVELDPTLQEVSRSPGPPQSAVVQTYVDGAGSLIRYDGRCVLCDTAQVALPQFEFSAIGGALRSAGDHSVESIAADGTLTTWTLPRRGGLLPGSGPSVMRIVWDVTSSVVGLDGAYYSLGQTPDHYELVRWNTAELPSKRFPPPAAKPPVIEAPPQQVMKVGTEGKVELRAQAGSGIFVTFSVSGLPGGAEFVPRYGHRLAAIFWTPTAGDVGSHVVTVTATDNACGKASQKVTIVVQP
jgi:hypothetical protein